MADVKELIDLLKGKITKKEEDFIKKAYKFAEQAHIGQRRLNGEPYFSHVFETAKLLGKLRVGVNTIVAGLLHDLLEDTKVNEAELEKEFGKDVLFLVKGVTKLGTLKYRGHERHIESLRKFFVAMADDIRVLIIKFADRLHNLRTLSSLREDKRQLIAIESIEVYASLANRLGMGKLKGALEDAAFPYAYPKEYAQVAEIIREKEAIYKKSLAEVRAELIRQLRKNKIKTHDKKSGLKWMQELKNLNYVPENPEEFIKHLKMDFFNNRIFVFTPKGDVIDLPEDSSPIDFAYSIHSDIGDHISGVKVNGKMTQIFSNLRNGDIVEIMNKRDCHPSSKWLEHTKTSVAKKHIRNYLEQNTLLSKLKSFGTK